MDRSGRIMKRTAERVRQRDAFKVTSEFIQFGADLISERSARTSKENVVISKENMED